MGCWRVRALCLGSLAALRVGGALVSVSDRVRRHLETDLVMVAGLARGILSYRRTARWLLDVHGWDATEEAIVSALRRCEPPMSRTIEGGYEVLEGARTGLSTGWALVETPALDDVQESIRDTIRPLVGPVGVLPGGSAVTYLVRERVARVLEADCAGDLEAVHRPVTQVRIELPREDPATGFALTILLRTFANRDVPLLGVVSSGREYTLLVPGSCTDAGHDTFLDLRND